MTKAKMHTHDLIDANIAKLADLFPGCITEVKDGKGSLKRVIDFELLQQELTDQAVSEPRERYRLEWPGKRAALLAANAPIAKTLRPAPGESVNFEATGNLFIEGDNLDALKLLQETYLNAIRVIYIDPPYNTGSDLVYRDDFRQDSATYLQASNQSDESGGQLTTNPESNGRFHSDWLTMFYPRMKLARNLLRYDGVILISIDDNEIANARKVCDEVFGETNLVANLIWEKGRKNDAKLFSIGHEYVLIYAKSLATLRQANTVWRQEKPGAREIWDKYLDLRQQYGDNDKQVESLLQAWYSSLPKTHPSKKWSRYKQVDSNGPWRDHDISWPGGGGPTYDVIHPVTKQPCKVPEDGWRFSKPEEMQRQIRLGLVEFRKDHTEPPFRKAHIRPVPEELEGSEADDFDPPEEEEQLATQVRGSYFYKQSQVGVKHLRKLLGAKAFNNPKDHLELAKLIDYVTGGDRKALVLDFFAGSGSTGHAVMHLNLNDGGSRRVFLVQYPEPLDPGKKGQAVAAAFCDRIEKPRTIAEITKERLRRSGQEILNEYASDTKSDVPNLLRGSSPPPAPEVGFRVLKVDTSNMRDAYYQPGMVAQHMLAGLADNVKEGRSEEDLLFQVLVDWGVDLTLPIEREDIGGNGVYFVDTNALAACFGTGLGEAFIKALAERRPLRAVFRDAGFGNDAMKINVEQIFKLRSPTTDVKSI